MTTLVGAGYRPELRAIFADGTAAVAELVLDRYGSARGAYRRPWDLAQVVGRIPVLLHGLSGNVGSVVGPRAGYVELVGERARSLGAIAYSDHLAMTRTATHGLGHLAPNLYDQMLLARATGHVERLAEALDPVGCPLVLENLAYDRRLSGSQWTAEEFTLRLLDATAKWSLLLDVTNLWVNSTNFAFDALAFLDALPPERIALVHMAGPQRFDDWWVDTHGAAVRDETFALLEDVLARPGVEPIAIVVERDTNFQGAEPEVRADLARVRSTLEGTAARRGAAQPRPTRSASLPA